jgi:hypothetical protein
MYLRTTLHMTHLHSIVNVVAAATVAANACIIIPNIIVSEGESCSKNVYENNRPFSVRQLASLNAGKQIITLPRVELAA